VAQSKEKFKSEEWSHNYLYFLTLLWMKETAVEWRLYQSMFCPSDGWHSRRGCCQSNLSPWGHCVQVLKPQAGKTQGLQKERNDKHTPTCEKPEALEDNFKNKRALKSYLFPKPIHETWNLLKVTFKLHYLYNQQNLPFFHPKVILNLYVFLSSMKHSER